MLHSFPFFIMFGVDYYCFLLINEYIYEKHYFSLCFTIQIDIQIEVSLKGLLDKEKVN